MLQVPLVFDAHNLKHDVEDALNQSIVRSAQPDAWLATVVSCLTESERRNRHIQTHYKDSYWNYVQTALEQFVGSFHLYTEYWVEDELCIMIGQTILTSS